MVTRNPKQYRNALRTPDALFGLLSSDPTPGRPSSLAPKSSVYEFAKSVTVDLANTFEDESTIDRLIIAIAKVANAYEIELRMRSLGYDAALQKRDLLSLRAPSRRGEGLKRFNVSQKVKSCEDAVKALDEALKYLDRHRDSELPSDRQIAAAVAPKVGIGTEAVRKYLRPRKERTSRSKR